MKGTDVLILLFICGIAAFMVYRYGNFEQFTNAPSITFMTAAETSDFLHGDADGYVKNLSPLDLHARRVKTHAQYLRNISEAAIDIPQNLRDVLNNASKRADALLAAGIQTHRMPMIEKLPWVFAMTKGDAYEEGMPHTRANIIFLSDSINALTPEEVTRTMIHEKMHVYQRMHPEHMMRCLEEAGYRRWKQRLGEPRVRANPDVDPWIYVDPNTQEPMVAYYTSDKPTSITDVILRSPSFEHPYEKMAYDVAATLMREKSLKKFLSL